MNIDRNDRVMVLLCGSVFSVSRFTGVLKKSINIMLQVTINMSLTFFFMIVSNYNKIISQP